MAKSLTVPTVHLNGTSAASLSHAYYVAEKALRGAIEMAQQTAPNPRDYYVQDGSAFGKASDEHIERLRKLIEVRAEFEVLYAAVVAVEEAP